MNVEYSGPRETVNPIRNDLRERHLVRPPFPMLVIRDAYYLYAGVSKELGEVGGRQGGWADYHWIEWVVEIKRNGA